jgi:hypothetical protein
MSFNRLMYDSCEGKQSLSESTGPGNYWNNTPVLCGNCLQTDPNIMPNRTGVSMNSNVPWRFYAGPIDVESDLLNLNRVASNCPSKQYTPKCTNCNCKNQGQPCGAGVISGCKNNGNSKIEGFTDQNNQGKLRTDGQRCQDNDLVSFPSCYFGTVNSRLNNPPSTLKGTGINRFTPLCHDPQANIMFPGEYQVPTRQIFRDNHRPCIPSLKTISQPSLPPAKPLPCPETIKTCGAFTSPLYQYDVCG